MKPHFNKVAILGVGLLGASLGLKIKEMSLANTIVGYGRGQANLKTAKKIKAIDEIAQTPEEALCEADLIILAAPINAVMAYLDIVEQIAKPGTLVMDVGSTKEAIVNKASRLFKSKKIYFVGAHPMAGTEQSGASAAFSGLYESSRCLLCYLGATPAKIKATSKKFWQIMGAKTIEVKAGRHDIILSLTSHLPQLSSYALFSVVAEQLDPKIVKEFSGNGLKDTTRLAASNADMWIDICQTNAKNMSKALSRLRFQIDWINRQIEKKDWGSLRTFFEKTAKQKRMFK